MAISFGSRKQNNPISDKLEKVEPPKIGLRDLRALSGELLAGVLRFHDGDHIKALTEAITSTRTYNVKNNGTPLFTSVLPSISLDVPLIQVPENATKKEKLEAITKGVPMERDTYYGSDESGEGVTVRIADAEQLARAPDGTVKRKTGDTDQYYVTVPTGLAVIRSTNPTGAFAFIENEFGFRMDLGDLVANLVNHGNAHNELNGNGKIHGVPLLHPHIVVPYVNRQPRFGNWGRVAYVDRNEDRSDFEVEKSVLNMSIIPADMLTRIVSSQTPSKTIEGFRTVDITDIVAEDVKSTGVKDGWVFINGSHTTVGIVRIETNRIKSLIKLLKEVAPDGGYYYHNNGFDANGQAHILTTITGAHTGVRLKDGKLLLDGNQRLHFIDFDITAETRDRQLTISVINIPQTDHELKSALRAPGSG